MLKALPAVPDRPSEAIFVPYLSGERTPHNDGRIRGAFTELSQDSDRAALTQAVLEGVAFSFRDCLDALRTAGTVINSADVIGGGSRSPTWIADSRLSARYHPLPARRWRAWRCLRRGAIGQARRHWRGPSCHLPAAAAA